MRRLTELDPIRPELEKYIEGMAGQMGDSTICLSLFTDNYKKGIDALLQFAVAVMMDKPLFLLVQKDTVIPEKVKKLADGIEFFDPEVKGSLEKASHKLLSQAQQKGFTA